MYGTPICDCGCCHSGCWACEPDCTSRQAPADDDGYSDYLQARAA